MVPAVKWVRPASALRADRAPLPPVLKLPVQARGLGAAISLAHAKNAFCAELSIGYAIHFCGSVSCADTAYGRLDRAQQQVDE